MVMMSGNTKEISEVSPFEFLSLSLSGNILNANNLENSRRWRKWRVPDHFQYSPFRFSYDAFLRNRTRRKESTLCQMERLYTQFRNNGFLLSPVVPLSNIYRKSRENEFPIKMHFPTHTLSAGKDQ